MEWFKGIVISHKHKILLMGKHILLFHWFVKEILVRSSLWFLIRGSSFKVLLSNLFEKTRSLTIPILVLSKVNHYGDWFKYIKDKTQNLTHRKNILHIFIWFVKDTSLVKTRDLQKFKFWLLKSKEKKFYIWDLSIRFRDQNKSFDMNWK